MIRLPKIIVEWKTYSKLRCSKQTLFEIEKKIVGYNIKERDELIVDLVNGVISLSIKIKNEKDEEEYLVIPLGVKPAVKQND